MTSNIVSLSPNEPPDTGTIGTLLLDQDTDCMDEDVIDVDSLDSESVLNHNMTSSCNHDFAIIDMLDTAYTPMSNGLGTVMDTDIGLLTNMDSSKSVSPKPDVLYDALVPSVPSDMESSSSGSLVDGTPVELLSNFTHLPIPAPEEYKTDKQLDNPFLLNHAATPAMMTLSGTTATTTAFAQVTKIEQGPGGKGYVLHLNIPALGLANVILPTPGLSLAPGTDEKLLAAGLRTDNVDNSSFCEVPDQVLTPFSLQGLSSLPEDQLDVQTSDYSGSCDSSDQSSLADSSTVTTEYVEDPIATDQANMHSVMTNVSSFNAAPAEDNLSLVNVAQWVEKPEVERFVICSDAPMECVLCSFKTMDYSAFKSHIICSHPCWRITKKLSKNRLLVEKSVKMNVNLVPQSCTEQEPDVINCNNKEFDPPKDGGSQDGSSTNNNLKNKKGLQVYQRRKQMLERNKRLFRCSVCMRLFVFEGSIVNHLVDHHLNKKPYDFIQVSNDHGNTFGNIHRCSYKNCYASCLTEEELERHRIESHAQVVFRCQICGFTAESSESVAKHAAQIHSHYDLMCSLVD